MKKFSVDSTLVSTGSKVDLFCALMFNTMNTMLGMLKVFGTIDVHGLPLNDWVLSVEMLFLQVVAVINKEPHGPVKDPSGTLVKPLSRIFRKIVGESPSAWRRARVSPL